MGTKNQQLQIELRDDTLNISIGINTLCHAVSIGRRYGTAGEITITDQERFVTELVRQLKREEEDGSTLIHTAFDEAVSNALEDGAEGLDYDG